MGTGTSYEWCDWQLAQWFLRKSYKAGYEDSPFEGWVRGIGRSLPFDFTESTLVDIGSGDGTFLESALSMLDVGPKSALLLDYRDEAESEFDASVASRIRRKWKSTKFDFQRRVFTGDLSEFVSIDQPVFALGSHWWYDEPPNAASDIARWDHLAVRTKLIRGLSSQKTFFAWFAARELDCDVYALQTRLFATLDRQPADEDAGVFAATLAEDLESHGILHASYSRTVELKSSAGLESAPSKRLIDLIDGQVKRATERNALEEVRFWETLTDDAAWRRCLSLLLRVSSADLDRAQELGVELPTSLGFRERHFVGWKALRFADG